jgi:hypothetical protein
MIIFSYGTLRQPEVQRAVFGRLLDGDPDSLTGFRIDHVAITDPAAIGASGSEVHLTLRRDPAVTAPIIGSALAIEAADLPAVDAYEGDTYARIEVVLGSGRTAFVYAAPELA